MSNSEGAALTATFHVRSDQLEIQYSIKNSRASAFYVVDTAVIVGPNGDVKVETARPAAEHLPPETLALFDTLLPLPPGVLTTVPRSAYAIRVEPGETHSRQVELSLPLRDRRLAPSAPSRVVTCTRIRFELGIINPGGELTAEEQMVAGTRLWRLNAAAYRQQQLLIIELPVTPSVSLQIADNSPSR